MSGERIETAGGVTALLEEIAYANTPDAAIILSGGRPWILTEDEDGDWWGWSFVYEGEDAEPTPADRLDLPWAVVYRPDRDLIAEAEERGAVRALLDFAAHFEKHGGAWGRMSVVEYIRGEYLDAVTGDGHACDNCSGIDPRSCINYDPNGGDDRA